MDLESLRGSLALRRRVSQEALGKTRGFVYASGGQLVPAEDSVQLKEARDAGYTERNMGLFVMREASRNGILRLFIRGWVFRSVVASRLVSELCLA